MQENWKGWLAAGMISVLLLTQAGTIPHYAGRLPPQITISMIIDKRASLKKKLTAFCMAIYLLLKDWLMDWRINGLIDWLLIFLIDYLNYWFINWVVGLINWLIDWELVNWLIQSFIYELTGKFGVLIGWLINWVIDMTGWLIDWLTDWLMID